MNTDWWLVDPYDCTVSVMALQGSVFQEECKYEVEDLLTSLTLPGLSIDLRDIFQSL